MESCVIPVRKRWIVISIWSAPNGVSNILWKLPNKVLHIIGVAFTQSEYEGEFAQLRIGELSLLCNDKLSHPLNFDIQKYTAVKRLDTIELALQEPIRVGARLTGFYKNCTNTEHLLKLYIHCIVKE